MNRNAREDVDDECDDTEDSREEHQRVHTLTEVDPKGSDVGCVAKNAKVKKQDRQFGRPDGEFVHDLGPPEPLAMLAIRLKVFDAERSYHKSS